MAISGLMTVPYGFDGRSAATLLAVGQHKQRARSQDVELTEQQDRRDQIVDHEGCF